MGLADRCKNKNKTNVTIKNSGNKYKKGKNKNFRNGKNKRPSKMDKKIQYINSLQNLDSITIKKITEFEGEWSYEIAKYFEKLNVNQLRDIHQLLKKIEVKQSHNQSISWDDVKLDYNMFKLNMNLKNERGVLDNTFYKLIYSFINIVDKIDENKKVETLNKIIILIDSIVGYHKYISNNKKEKSHESLKKIKLRINSEYLLNIEKNDNYVKDSEKIANTISTEKNITIYQLRKIFNVYRSMESMLDNTWSSISDEYHMFYPKLAYICGRGLISEEFFKLIIHCMNIIDNGDNKEILKFKNFNKLYEAIISFYTYRTVKENKNN